MSKVHRLRPNRRLDPEFWALVTCLAIGGAVLVIVLTLAGLSLDEAFFR